MTVSEWNSRMEWKNNLADIMSWMGVCGECGVYLVNPRGIFCANFCVGRDNFPPCQKAWCGVCYKEAPGCKFPIRELVEKENDTDLVVDKEDVIRFKEGQNRDHLMGVPFF